MLTRSSDWIYLTKRYVLVSNFMAHSPLGFIYNIYILYVYVYIMNNRLVFLDI